MSLLRGTLLAAASATMLAAARFLLSAIVARRLDVDSFGAFAYSMWLVDTAFLVCSFGTSGAAARYFAEYQGQPVKESAFRKLWMPWAIAAPIVASVAACIGAWMSGLEMTTSQRWLLAVWAAMSAMWALLNAVNIARQRFALVCTSSVVFLVVVVSGAALLPLDLTTVLGIMVSAYALSTAVLAPRRRERGVFQSVSEPQDLHGVYHYATNIWITALLWGLVWSRGEFVVVRAVVGDGALGAYAAAMVLFAGAAQAVMVWVGAVAPELTKLLAAGMTEGAIRIARRCSDAQLVLASMLAVLLAGCARPLVRGVFGSNYVVAEDALIILAPGLIGFAAAAQNHLLQVTSAASFNRNVSMIGLVILFAIAYLLVPLYGVEGGAIARLVALLAMFGISVWTSLRRFGAEALPVKNTAIGLATVLLIAFVQIAVPSELLASVLMTGGALMFLIVAMRDDSGRPLAVALLQFVLTGGKSAGRLRKS